MIQERSSKMSLWDASSVPLLRSLLDKITHEPLRRELLSHPELQIGLVAVGLRAGQVLFAQGDLTHFCFLVVEGSLKLSLNGFKSETTLTILSEGEIGGVLLMNQSRTSTFPAAVVALTPATVLKIPKETYFTHWRSNKVVSDYMSECVQQRIAHLHEDKQLQVADVETRVIHFLVRHYIEKKDLLRKSITRKQIAQAIGTKTETVIRVIKKLEKEGFIEINKSVISILDPQRLRSLRAG